MNKLYIGFIIILSAGIICAGQTVKHDQTSSSTLTAEKSGKDLTTAASSNVAAQLQSSIDVKKAKVGDEVVLRTTKTIKENGQTVIPKGTNLVGRITEVQQRSEENAMSRIGMVFDRMEGKNLTSPITASIVSITNIQAASAVGDSFGSDVNGSTQSSGSVRRGGSSGGGLLGGVGNSVGGVVNTTTQTVGGLANTAVQTVGNVTNTAGQTVGNTAGTLGGTLKGIQISNSISGSANSSTTLSTPNKNLRLEKGVMFQMQVDKQASN